MSRYAEAHKIANLGGAGDARPTALQIIKDEELVGKLNDKVFLITGVSSGIGIDTLRALHTTGAHVYGTVRNMPKGQAVVDQVLSEKHEGGGKIDLIEMDLSSFASVRSGANAFLQASSSQLNLLIGNAGIMACPFSKTPDGYESQFATNHLGHFLLFQLLKPALLASATPAYPSRYVSLSSLAHCYAPPDLSDINFEKTAYDPWIAYGRSKTANVWLANAIERRYAAQHLHATSVHPGGIFDTGLGVHITDEFKQALLDDEATRRTFKNSAQGAATTVYAGVSREWAAKGGRYLSSCTEQRSHEERKDEEGMYDNANEGYASWAYDGEGEERLWRESARIVGVAEE
jgi:NAD(P)-dependent dehydrogenase (short-subunit alcohol dehydrogenase family)